MLLQEQVKKTLVTTDLVEAGLPTQAQQIHGQVSQGWIRPWRRWITKFLTAKRSGKGALQEGKGSLEPPALVSKPNISPELAEARLGSCAILCRT